MLISKPIVPGVRPLLSIVSKYNMRRFLYFIVTENAGSTNTGIPYLSNYPEQFNNVAIHPVASPLIMYKFFGYVNGVYSHKNQGSLIWCWKISGLISVVG